MTVHQKTSGLHVENGNIIHTTQRTIGYLIQEADETWTGTWTDACGLIHKTAGHPSPEAATLAVGDQLGLTW